ncbi:DUF6263 family protein [Pedobacter rhodius]|uniref:DUF6263 family protein n=1 Tax=Pedobacter rhodius TaxID=3004098 RepID=A0ABT4KYS9_9SPHI|nr:DUF6263 family protein [Pedobacter sp. SJ11]MCZ4223945.1 DUF6263 family protein [Pedobacter sp. SJ11]
MKAIKILSVILCLLSLSAFGQKTYILKQEYPVGKKYSYAINSDQIINQKIDGKEISYIQNVGTDYIFNIKSLKGIDKTIQVTYKRLTIKSVGMGNELILDSDKEEAGKPNPFSGLKNAGFSMLLASNGTVKSISGVDKMVDSIAAKMTTDTAQLKQMKLSLGKQFNAEVIRQTMESSLKIFPDKAVKIGESWVVNTKMQITMPIEAITTYTLKEVKDNVATISIKGSLISKGNFETMGNKMQTDLKGMNIGDAQVDIRTGIILNSHTRTELYGKMKASEQDIDFDLEGINKIVGKEIN